MDNQSPYTTEMNFCRRCGTKLTHKSGPLHVCEQGHKIFTVAAPAVGVVITNDNDEVLLLERAIEPGKGQLDIPGGFCDGPETLEAAIVRELQEEVGLESEDYTAPEFLLSYIDAYDFGGETLPVSGTMFTAKIRTAKQPVAADDAASVTWVPLSQIDFTKVYFASVRAALERVLNRR